MHSSIDFSGTLAINLYEEAERCMSLGDATGGTQVYLKLTWIRNLSQGTWDRFPPYNMPFTALVSEVGTFP